MAPQNAIHIVQGEIAVLLSYLKRDLRHNKYSQDDQMHIENLFDDFATLKDSLNSVDHISDIDPEAFLSPFLELITVNATMGRVTGLAITSINKFLSYNLINESTPNLVNVIEMIGVAVLRANFHGTDHTRSSDEAVLAKILQVLRTLLMLPVGAYLSNSTVYEIFKSCLFLCFEKHWSELMRRIAEFQLVDIIQLLFARLPLLQDDISECKSIKDRSSKVKHTRIGSISIAPISSNATVEVEDVCVEITKQEVVDSKEACMERVESELFDERAIDTSTPFIAKTLSELHKDYADKVEEDSSDKIEEQEPKPEYVELSENSEVKLADDNEVEDSSTKPEEPCTVKAIKEELDLVSPAVEVSERNISLTSYQEAVSESKSPASEEVLSRADVEAEGKVEISQPVETPENTPQDYVNEKGIRFTNSEHSNSLTTKPTTPIPAALHVANTKRHLGPYGLLCVREILKRLVALVNPHDRNNSEAKIDTCLNLLALVFEVSSEYLPEYPVLLELVRNDLCKNLVSLLCYSGTTVFSSSLRLGYLIYEAMRSNLKFQLEIYLTRLMDIVTPDASHIPFEHRELALECLVQMWRVPGFVTELFLNYDCDIYCSNLFKDITELLSKNAFTTSGIFSTHLLSLDALLTVIDSIESHCHSKVISTSSSSRSHDEHLPEKHNKKDTSSDNFLNDNIKGHLNVAGTGYQSARSQQIKSRSRSQHSTSSNKSFDLNPTDEVLFKNREKKKLLLQGTDQFNKRPAKGLAFLTEHKILDQNNNEEIVQFLKENPKLDKKVIGDYISNKKNSAILKLFCQSFSFHNQRIDESLRDFLETFRLPGEAPLITHLLEHFSSCWHVANNNCFADDDAAYILAYSVIMLNTDQHNTNAKKQNLPMTLDDFKRNLKGVNGKADFDHEMLAEIYLTIKNDEIVMPSEQTGLVRDNYLWKLILKRGATDMGNFIRAPVGRYDSELFSLIWGPTVAALSHIFDKTIDDTIIPKAISGFRKCAMISADYGLSDVFDNLIISLCKFTGLFSASETCDTFPVQFGHNLKAQLAAKTVFGLTHRHGDILREGWKNLLNCLLHLYKAKLLPDSLIEVKDFIHPSGKIRLIKDEPTHTKPESGVLSSFYFSIFADTSSHRGISVDEQNARQKALDCIKECNIEQLIQDTKFLRMDSLSELVKDLIFATQENYQTCQDPGSDSASYDEEASVFYLELLMQVLLQNRDRLSPLWGVVRSYFYQILIGSQDTSFLMERSIVGLLRLVHRLLHREDMSSQVFSCLCLLILAKPKILHSVSRQVIFGLHDLINTHAQNIHTEADWKILFALLEVCGAGARPSSIYIAEVASSLPEGYGPVGSLSHSGGDRNGGASSDTETCYGEEAEALNDTNRGYTSDSELYTTTEAHKKERDMRLDPSTGSWVLVDRVYSDLDLGERRHSQSLVSHILAEAPPVNQYSIALQDPISQHDGKALIRACETLTFVIRDTAHVTPSNFESCVHAVRVFVEASLHGGKIKKKTPRHAPAAPQDRRQKRGQPVQRRGAKPARKQSVDSSESDDAGHSDSYHKISVQLLDLMHTLHTRVAGIFKSWAPQQSAPSYAHLWDRCWCPLLQGMARLACDSRRDVRMQALTYLQRSLLFHDLQQLRPGQWEMCFNKVLFPLLACLLELPAPPGEEAGAEETRVRAAALLSKVFLMHLSPLLSLPTFTALWLTILDFMERYIRADKSDLLIEAIPESLKNMLLVMDNASILRQSQLWELTWHRISAFLPGLMEDLFPQPKPEEASAVVEAQPQRSPKSEKPPVPLPVPELVATDSPAGVPSTEDTNPPLQQTISPGSVKDL